MPQAQPTGLMKHLNPEFTAKGAIHDYHVGVWDDTTLTTQTTVRVWARNRDQACRIAERAGYVVRDVNMVG